MHGIILDAAKLFTVHNICVLILYENMFSEIPPEFIEYLQPAAAAAVMWTGTITIRDFNTLRSLPTNNTPI